ncbi:quinone oxidoreductase [Haliangium sp. UPWRP_2]|nr:quinone oxidoreductase [Haliangium sp. UPWRP_2]
MNAVVQSGFGGPEVLRISRIARPTPGPSDLLVRVHAAGLNRADVLQREGEYIVPEGQSPIIGIEIAGVVEAVGAEVNSAIVGQRVFGVVAGGGYAEYCLLDHGMAIPIPTQMGFVEAAAIAEAGLTAHETLFTLGQLGPGQRILIHAAASGIGTMMVQMARASGATIYATTGTHEKASRVQALGADHVINYREEDFARTVQDLTRGEGVHVVEDFIGGAWLERNLEVVREGGVLVIVGLLDGLQAPLDLLKLVERRIQIKGSSLRLRSLEEKRDVTRRFRERWMPEPEHALKGLQPVVHRVYRMEQLAAAHSEMENNRNVGKIILQIVDASV